MRTGYEEERRGISKELRKNEGEEHWISGDLENRPIHRFVLRVLARDDALPDQCGAAQAHDEGDKPEKTQRPRYPSAVD